MPRLSYAHVSFKMKQSLCINDENDPLFLKNQKWSRELTETGKVAPKSREASHSAFNGRKPRPIFENQISS